MKTFSNPYLLRIFLHEASQVEHHKPLYEKIIDLAQENKISGATVIKGCLGFGSTAQMLSAKILVLSTDLPVIIEILDEKEKLDAFLEKAKPTLQHVLVTFQKIEQALQM